MITSIPENWDYKKENEMLFLFYQCTDELLSEQSNDSYLVPLHNAMTLSYEMRYIYNALDEYNLIDNYYVNYVNGIIDEFLASLKDDKILKKFIGKRLESIRHGFEDAKSNPSILKRWINQLHQSCNIDKYLEAYKEEIINLVVNTKNKREPLSCCRRYYTSLIYTGYSREHLYVTTKKFFNNYNRAINSNIQVKEFLDEFDCQNRKYEYIVLIDLNSIEYLDSISDRINFNFNRRIKKIDIDNEREKLCEDICVLEMFKQYDNLINNQKKYQKISIVRYESRALDPYNAIAQFNNYINFIQSFSIYFKHHRLNRQIFKILMKKDDGKYVEISERSKLLKRPYITQEQIDSRIEDILNAESLSREAFISLTEAIIMHSEALESQNMNTLVKSLWTALETLFSNLGTNEVKTNVIDSTLAIIQKTYILKVLRSIYKQIMESISNEDAKIIQIETFEKFVEYFSSNTSQNMRPLYEKIGENILLRTRIDSLRNDWNDGRKILKYLENHETKIKWQLQRIYRTRNMATHLGMEMYYSDIVVNHLHNYFDFVCNFLICKISHRDYISNIAAIVFEARNDNTIHKEMLKSEQELCKENYMEYLFGPDNRLVKYEFE